MPWYLLKFQQKWSVEIWHVNWKLNWLLWRARQWTEWRVIRTICSQLGKIYNCRSTAGRAIAPSESSKPVKSPRPKQSSTGYLKAKESITTSMNMKTQTEKPLRSSIRNSWTKGVKRDRNKQRLEWKESTMTWPDPNKRVKCVLNWSVIKPIGQGKFHQWQAMIFKRKLSPTRIHFKKFFSFAN